MKKFFAFLLTFAVLAASVVIPSFAADEMTPGGLDFYSLTIHYKAPVVVDYRYVTADEQIQVKDADGNPVVDEDGEPVYVDKGYVFNDPKTEYVISANEYNQSYGGNQVFSYGEAMIRSRQWAKRFYSVNSADYNIDSSLIEVNANYGLTNIQNGNVICLIMNEKLKGVDEQYDDAGNPNPNFQRDENGYFLDASVDEQGNHLRIDVNEFVIDANNIWHDSDGRRIEPFIIVGDTYYWIDLASRLDANGKVIDYKTITNASLIEKGVLTLPEKYQNIDEYDENRDYDGDGTPGKSADRRAHKALVTERDTWLKVCDIMLYRVDFQDTNGDGVKTDADLAEYNSKDRTFTEADILTNVRPDGTVVKVNGTPEHGTYVSTAEIDKITVEIDALGTSMPADVASDPQQKNEIIVTIGDLYENIKAAQEYVAAHPEKEFTGGQIIGTAKSVTTKTAMSDEDGLPSTVKSVDVQLTEGLEFPAYGLFYLQFNIAELQPAEATNYDRVSRNNYKLDPLNKAKLDVEKLPNAPTPTPNPDDQAKKGCGSVVTGSVALVGVMAAAVLVFRKKED